jgi:ribosomal protein S18 acetylase RimI-like enzyme
MLVRRAQAAEAREAADVIRRSITELCAADYRGDPEVLARWLANQTDENLRRWIGDAGRLVCVAVAEDGRLAAVGMAANRGEIQLNYVAPEFRLRGAGKALVAHMEAHLRSLGVGRVTLLSTQAARRFYRSIGYEEGGRVESRFGTLDVIEMTKRLA